MGRLSSDELAADGTILNGFDYHLQVWVIGGGRHYNLPYGRPCDVQAEQERSRTWNP